MRKEYTIMTKEAEIKKKPRGAAENYFKRSRRLRKPGGTLKETGKRHAAYRETGAGPFGAGYSSGHAVVLRKIKQMQDLGHRAVIVIGDFTGKSEIPAEKQGPDGSLRRAGAGQCRRLLRADL